MANLLARTKINWQTVFIALLIGVVIIYIATVFVSKSGDTFSFNLPESSKWVINSFVIVIVGIAALLGLTLATSIGQPKSGRDAATYILVAAGLFLLWVYVLHPILGLQSLDQIGTIFAKKTGMLP